MSFRQFKDGLIFYLVKWRDLPYDQAIWESEDSGIPDFQKFIDEYYDLRLEDGRLSSAYFSFGLR